MSIEDVVHSWDQEDRIMDREIQRLKKASYLSYSL